MAEWGKRLRSLLVGGGESAPKKRPADSAAAKTTQPPSNRAAILAEAMAIYRRERAGAWGVLERTLRELAAKPPKPSDIAGMTRLLNLRRAVLRMKSHMANDEKRGQIVASVKGLLGPGAGTKPAPAGDQAPKPTAKRPPSLGTKR